MRAYWISIFLLVGSCSQYEVMYSGALNRKPVPMDAEMEEPIPPVNLPPKPIIIRGDCDRTVWVSEIHPDPKNVPDRQGEYLELYNPNPLPIRLNGWRLSDTKQDGHTLRSSKPIEIEGKSYFVLGVNANQDTNGNVPIDYQYQRFNLSNEKDSVRLEDACGNLVEQIIYPGPKGWRKKVRAGFAMERVRTPNPQSEPRWKRARNRLQNGDYGTPGAGPWPRKTHRKTQENQKETTDKTSDDVEVRQDSLWLPEQLFFPQRLGKPPRPNKQGIRQTINVRHHKRTNIFLARQRHDGPLGTPTNSARLM